MSREALQEAGFRIESLTEMTMFGLPVDVVLGIEPGVERMRISGLILCSVPDQGAASQSVMSSPTPRRALTRTTRSSPTGPS